MEEDYNEKAADRLKSVLEAAASQAGMQTLLKVAEQCGVTEIEGHPVETYYEKLRIQIVDRKLASHADHNMALVSAMKRLWERLRNQS